MAKETTTVNDGVDKNLLGYFVGLGAAVMFYPAFLFGSHYATNGSHGLISSQTPVTAPATTAAPSGKG